VDLNNNFGRIVKN